MSRPPLAVWLYGTRVGLLHETAHGLELVWTEQAYQRWGSASRVVSHLLPMALPGRHPEPARVRVFLDGLLPEGNARTNYALDAGLALDDTFGLIAAYGRDTAGALVFQDPDEPEPTGTGNYTGLTDEQVGQRLLDADRHAPTDPDSGVASISLAGMMPKIALHRIDGHWHACGRGAPSTWILKRAHPANSTAADVVDTEALCANLATRIGLGGAEAFVAEFGGVRTIAVQRYDRVLDHGAVRRLHQEDLAQALGLNTGDPERKFQRGRALPSLAHAADVLRAGGTEPDQLLRLVTFSHAVGNTDLHAKNISVLRAADGTATLAPAYDVSMHLHHPTREPLSALDVHHKQRMHQIDASDLVAEGRTWGLPAKRSAALVADTLEQLHVTLDEVDLDAHPGVTEAATDLVHRRVKDAQRVIAQPHGAADATRPRRRPRRRR